MNGYIGFFNGRRTEVYADTLYEAKTKAIAHFKPTKSKAHMVSVMLAETNVPVDAEGKPTGSGVQVVHRAVD
jgi:hypothetical protein